MNHDVRVAYGKLQDHVNTIRDRIEDAKACLYRIPVRDTFPERNFERLADELDKLAFDVREHIRAMQREHEAA